MEYVESLLEIHFKYVKFANDVFMADASFIAAVDKVSSTKIGLLTVCVTCSCCKISH